MRRVRRVAVVVAAACLASLVALLAPIAYVETACAADAAPDVYVPIIRDEMWRRPEARTFLTYPEWQMVYAYQEFAKVLAQGDEHEFGYLKSLGSFWSSYCVMNRQAAVRGGSDWPTRSMLYTIGTSFNVEMLIKALYEETLGRFAAFLRGREKAPQDAMAASMAHEYGAFLLQTPWYRYPFGDQLDRLWNAPVNDVVRGWERRLALGAEWGAKRAYAALIEQAVEATGKDQLRIRSVLVGLSPEQLRSIEGMSVVEATAEYVVVETDRYALFTAIVGRVAEAGGDLVEVAGNDDIMASVLREPEALPWPSAFGSVLADIPRQGSSRRRSLIGLKVSQLTALFRQASEIGAEVEHVYDY